MRYQVLKKTLSIAIIVFALIFIYAPIIFLFIYSFTPTQSVGVWEGFSMDNYLKLFNTPKLRDMIIDTVTLALLAAVISTMLGTLAAIGIFYNKKWLGKLTKGASQIPIISAEVVTAISLVLLFSFLGMYKSYISLLIGHVVLCTPFVILSILPRLKQMDPSLYEAALDLGATPTQALFKVIIPEILPGIFSGFMLAITLSLDDYMITAYTMPFGFETISTYTYSVNLGRESAVDALKALSSIIFILMVIAVIVMNFRASKKKAVK